jgi:hypothetical protein
LDTREWFEGDKTKDYFLFADGCHFSIVGHQHVFNRIAAVNQTTAEN